MIRLVNENILNLKVDAIINPANVSLLAGSGLCGVIHKHAGNELEALCKTIGKQEYGSAVITPGFKLPNCTHIIHACGPRYLDGNRGEPEVLAKTHYSIIEVASRNDIRSIAIPAISTGIYRFPVDLAAKIAIQTVSKRLLTCDIEVYFTAKDIKTYQIFNENLISISARNYHLN